MREAPKPGAHDDGAEGLRRRSTVAHLTPACTRSDRCFIVSRTLFCNLEAGGSVEREVLLTGIGGQGVQLAAEVLARAALADGLEVQLFGSYGGMMRGGNTDATLVLADGPIEAPPTLSSAWSAIVMHPEHAAPVVHRVRAGGMLFINTTVFDTVPAPPGITVVPIAATDIAIDLGNVMTASIVMTAAYAAVTKLVTLESLIAAVAASLPPYRAQHIALNERALHAGYDAASELVVDVR
jgi:Pyruvate/2-oxoacid:ferredoxin oxidoreductase gamma subunit